MKTIVPQFELQRCWEPTLGNNEVDTVTVVSPAFSRSLAVSVERRSTKLRPRHQPLSWQLSYYWDGRSTNANDWFNKQSQATTATEPTRICECQ